METSTPRSPLNPRLCRPERNEGSARRQGPAKADVSDAERVLGRRDWRLGPLAEHAAIGAGPPDRQQGSIELRTLYRRGHAGPRKQYANPPRTRIIVNQRHNKPCCSVSTAVMSGLPMDLSTECGGMEIWLGWENYLTPRHAGSQC